MMGDPMLIKRLLSLSKDMRTPWSVEEPSSEYAPVWQLLRDAADRIAALEADLARVTAERDALREELTQWKAGGSMGTIAQWREDAERWRDVRNGKTGDWRIGRWWQGVVTWVLGTDADNAIDAARKEGGK